MKQHALKDESPSTATNMNANSIENMPSEQIETVPEEEDPALDNQYLQGIRFWATSISLALMLFLATMEVSIVTTSLVAITDEIGGLEKASWFLSSYQLGYVGVIVVFAKFSDIVGRKTVFCTSIVAFAIFSGACGAVQTSLQLIILRAFQGVGGGGSFALSVVILIEVVPPSQYARYVSNMNIAVALALVLGPVLGGAISSSTTWRWVFLLNLPAGFVALCLAVVGIPRGFPHHHRKASRSGSESKDILKRVDIPGSTMMLMATVALTAGFQQAGSEFPWKSAYVITLLVCSFLLWVALLAWERYITIKDGLREPVLPWRFLTNRVTVSIFLGFTLVGGSLTVTTFQLPQRFQMVNGLSAFDAALRLIPFGAAFPVGCVLGANISSKLRIPPIFIVFTGVALQILGFALLSTTPASVDIPDETYGFEILAGVGCGACYQCLYIMIPFVAERRDHSVGMGMANQLRMMGGAVILAIATSVFNGHVISQLENLGMEAALTEGLAKGSSSSDPEDEARSILSEGYNLQMVVLAAFAAAQVPAAMLMWRKKQIATP